MPRKLSNPRHVGVYSKKSRENWPAGRLGPHGRQFFPTEPPWAAASFYFRPPEPQGLPGRPLQFFLLPPFGVSSFYFRLLSGTLGQFFLRTPFPGLARIGASGQPIRACGPADSLFYSKESVPAACAWPGPGQKESEKKLGRGWQKESEKNWAVPWACPDPASFFYRLPGFYFRLLWSGSRSSQTPPVFFYRLPAPVFISDSFSPVFFGLLTVAGGGGLLRQTPHPPPQRLQAARSWELEVTRNVKTRRTSLHYGRS